MLTWLFEQKRTAPAPSPDGFVAAPGPYADAHALIDRVLHTMPDDLATSEWSTVFMELLEQHVATAPVRRHAEVKVAMIERMTYARRNARQIGPHITWCYTQAAHALLQGPVGLSVKHLTIILDHLTERVNLHIYEPLINSVLDHVETHKAASIKHSNTLDAGLCKRLKALVKLHKKEGHSNHPRSFAIRIRTLLGAFDPIEEMHKQLGIASFGMGTIRQMGVLGFPIYNDDPLADAHVTIEAILKECDTRNIRYNLRPKELTTLQDLTQQDRTVQKDVVLAILYRIVWDNVHDRYGHTETRELANALLRRRLPFSQDEAAFFLYTITAGVVSRYMVSVPNFLKSVEVLAKAEDLSPALTEALVAFQDVLASSHSRDDDQLRRRLTKLLGTDTSADEVTPFVCHADDAFGQQVNVFLEAQAPVAQKAWWALLHHSSTAKGSKPSKKYLRMAAQHIDAIGAEAFRATMADWLTLIGQMDGLRPASYVWQRFAGSNSDVAKGLVWCLATYRTPDLDAVLETTVLHTINVTPESIAVGNAGLYVLGHTKSLGGIGILARLKRRIRRTDIRRRIDAYIDATAHALGLTRDEVEDSAVADHGLTEGACVFPFGDFAATLHIVRMNKTEVRWQRPDGKTQKTTPKAVRDTFGDEVKAISATAKAIKKTLAAQRDRLDRSYIANRTWTYADFRTYYLDHGLMAFLTQRLLWSITWNDTTRTLIPLDGVWTDASGEMVETIPDGAEVQLWHPVGQPVEDVLRWRTFITEREIVQPFKQAFREVYLLTDAELNTGTYSNRMAAHLLKQHQFASLARTRGWQYTLMGAFDDGRYNEYTSINLPAHQMQAQFWVNEVAHDDAFNETGIWHYVATDQVRFIRSGESEPTPLETINPLVFSEVIRDVDLFVGVASVGNDPNWADSGGLVGYRDYWHSYSFGELPEVAKTRRAVLERLVPRLKIRDVCTLTDRFLTVKGTLRTYQIHIGSGNILMKPNDEYLCIVPDSRKRASSPGVYLPFEGDRTLSIILSKAFLLAADDQITDPTITRQIRWR